MSGSVEFHCAVCGAPARQPYHSPRGPEIAPDLDMRPGEPVRSTLRDWVQGCGQCGAAAHDLSVLPQEAGSIVSSPAYRALSTNGTEDTLLFRRWAMICQGTGNDEMAAEATLQAAWAADDGADMLEAARLRRSVVDLWSGNTDLPTGLRRLDVLRRAGSFDELLQQARRLGGRFYRIVLEIPDVLVFGGYESGGLVENRLTG
jgi:hypothetical protein